MEKGIHLAKIGQRRLASSAEAHILIAINGVWVLEGVSFKAVSAHAAAASLALCAVLGDHFIGRQLLPALLALHHGCHVRLWVLVGIQLTTGIRVSRQVGILLKARIRVHRLVRILLKIRISVSVLVVILMKARIMVLKLLILLFRLLPCIISINEPSLRIWLPHWRLDFVLKSVDCITDIIFDLEGAVAKEGALYFFVKDVGDPGVGLVRQEVVLVVAEVLGKAQATKGMANVAVKA